MSESGKLAKGAGKKPRLSLWLPRFSEVLEKGHLHKPPSSLLPPLVPKVIVHRLLKPALRSPESLHVVCYEGKPTALLARLSVHELDLVLSDSPMSPEVKLRAFNHQLGAQQWLLGRLSSGYQGLWLFSRLVQEQTEDRV
ncbi:hypothetical protein MYX84_14180 [Acidobacteria bacterium AH-259-O06]|nr:hypothetical protein [Acidobacteria bacterium AH-259-O06]